MTVVGWTIAILSSVLGIIFVATLFAAPQMASLRLPGQLSAINLTDLEFKAKDPARLKSAAKLGNKALAEREEQARIWRERAAERHSTNSLMSHPKGRPWTMVFYGNWGDASANFADLERELPKVDWVLPTWLNFGGDDLSLKTSFDSNLVSYVRGTKPSVAILPTLQNASGG
ncbi:MAG TPA: hypothetical protein VKB71_10645, partial [Rhizomicrobium sp.]|nr:hypothetical protein [Rhizomicrobium sp.]